MGGRRRKRTSREISTALLCYTASLSAYTDVDYRREKLINFYHEFRETSPTNPALDLIAAIANGDGSFGLQAPSTSIAGSSCYACNNRAVASRG
jgi:hypothetical protein